MLIRHRSCASWFSGMAIPIVMLPRGPTVMVSGRPGWVHFPRSFCFCATIPIQPNFDDIFVTCDDPMVWFCSVLLLEASGTPAQDVMTPGVWCNLFFSCLLWRNPSRKVLLVSAAILAGNGQDRWCDHGHNRGVVDVFRQW